MKWNKMTANLLESLNNSNGSIIVGGRNKVSCAFDLVHIGVFTFLNCPTANTVRVQWSEKFIQIDSYKRFHEAKLLIIEGGVK